MVVEIRVQLLNALDCMRNASEHTEMDINKPSAALVHSPLGAGLPPFSPFSPSPAWGVCMRACAWVRGCVCTVFPTCHFCVPVSVGSKSVKCGVVSTSGTHPRSFQTTHTQMRSSAFCHQEPCLLHTGRRCKGPWLTADQSRSSYCRLSVTPHYILKPAIISAHGTCMEFERQLAIRTVCRTVCAPRQRRALCGERTFRACWRSSS